MQCNAPHKNLITLYDKLPAISIHCASQTNAFLLLLRLEGDLQLFFFYDGFARTYVYSTAKLARAVIAWSSPAAS